MKLASNHHVAQHSAATNDSGAAPIAAPTPLPVLLENLPDELTRIPRWVVWRYEWRDRWTKPPFQPNGKRAAVNRDSSLNSFPTICAAYATGEFAGIGFALAKDGGHSGVDLDDVRNPTTGELEPVARAIVDALNSYTEVSPSGRGLRIFTRGAIPIPQGKDGQKVKVKSRDEKSLVTIEAYNAGRYLTLTGQKLDGTPSEINERTDELATFHALYFTPKERSNSLSVSPVSAPQSVQSLDDKTLVEKATRARNGARFRALWHGDISAHGDDRSAADFALLTSLRFWTQADGGRMDALFRSSGLMRPKWDEIHGGQTYGELTIANNLKANAGKPVYSGKSNQSSVLPSNSGFQRDDRRDELDDVDECAATADTEKKEKTPEQIRAAFKSACSQSAPVSLEEVVEKYRKWMFVKDDGLIKVALATFAANLCDGDPVWLMIVGGSSSGKTETINPLSALPFGRLVGTLTESSFLSGSPKRDKSKDASGGILREMGSFGVLLFKDFTSILSIHHDKRISVLAALREIYDGAWTRDIGTDGGRKLEWRGKMGIIACCTDAIESAHAVSGAMGERFMRYRLQHDDDDQRAMARHALKRVGRDTQMRTELEEAVIGFFGTLTIESAPEHLTELETERLISIAMLTAKARSVVDRDAKSRDIELTHDAEIPVRLVSMLRRVLHGLRIIGVPNREAWAIVQKVALDSIPKLRGEIIQLVAQEIAEPTGTPLTANRIQKALKTSAQSARRALEELRAHCILEDEDATLGTNRVANWTFSEFGSFLWNEGFSPFPVKSVSIPTQPKTNTTDTEGDLTLNLPLRISSDKTGKGDLLQFSDEVRL